MMIQLIKYRGSAKIFPYLLQNGMENVNLSKLEEFFSENHLQFFCSSIKNIRNSGTFQISLRKQNVCIK